MALSDCSKCWDTPCRCGFGYKDYTKDYMIKFIKSIVSHKELKEQVEIIKEVLNNLENER